MQKKDIRGLRAYEAISENADTAVISYSTFPTGSGPKIGVPKRKENEQVIKVNHFSILKGDSPASAFAIGLHTCSAFIYIYPKEKSNVNQMYLKDDKEAIDHLVVYHSPSSIIKSDRDPLTFNSNHANPKNIKVIIGTPNAPHEQGINEVIIELIERYQILKENIFVYYRCGGSFGADSYGNIGEMGGSFNLYVTNILINCFIATMQDSMKDSQPQQPVTTQHQFIKKLAFWQTTEEQYAEKFINMMKDSDSIESIFKIVEDYLQAGDAKHPLKSIFLQKLANQLNKIKSAIGFELSPSPKINEIKEFLFMLSNQIKQEADLNLESLKSSTNVSITNENKL